MAAGGDGGGERKIRGDSPLQFEMFSAAMVSADDLWALVGDPRRAPEWTDADDVDGLPGQPPALAVGTRFTTRDAQRRLEWVVITVADRLLEVKTDGCEAGRFGLGVRVVDDPVGARLVLAGMLDPVGGRIRARTLDLPALRRRCERWVDIALRTVAGR